MPDRATLARRLRKKSVDTVDRTLKELVALGAVSVDHQYAGGQRLTNRYRLHASQPPTDGTTPHGATVNEHGCVCSSKPLPGPSCTWKAVR